MLIRIVRFNGAIRRLAIMIAMFLLSGVGATDIDAKTGLVVAPGWEMARAHCGICHSYRLVTANRGDRDYWLKTVRWMQRTQNLWPIQPEQENPLLDYLAANYNETEWGRRPQLSPALRPE